MSTSKPAPSSLIAFQKSYSERLRNPDSSALPNGIPARASEVYEGLVFNNICGFIDKCFPVAQTLVQVSQWVELERHFFAHWRNESPIFSDIPKAFCDCIAQSSPHAIPTWLPELLHYEWLELAIDLSTQDVPEPRALLSESDTIAINPTLANQSYAWPVHRICTDFIPNTPTPTCLLIFRDFQHQVRFIEVNATTAALVDLIQHHPKQNADYLLMQMSSQLPDIPVDAVMAFGAQLISELITQNALISFPS